MQERYQLDYVQLDPNWLERQIREVREEIANWPAWMRDAVTPEWMRDTVEPDTTNPRTTNGD